MIPPAARRQPPRIPPMIPPITPPDIPPDFPDEADWVACGGGVVVGSSVT